MTSKMAPAEIAERLEWILQNANIAGVIDGIDRMALSEAAEIVRKVERGELVDIVRCGSCKRYNSTNCPAWNECTKSTANYMTFCNAGERKDGEEKLKDHRLYKFYYGEQCVYLGRTSQDFKNRLRGHFFKKPMHRAININLVTKIETVVLPTQADMFLYEIYYINKLRPALNVDDKAIDGLGLTVNLPELEFQEYKLNLLDKWKLILKDGDTNV
jgi:hypothetical protein